MDANWLAREIAYARECKARYARAARGSAATDGNILVSLSQYAPAIARQAGAALPSSLAERARAHLEAMNSHQWRVLGEAYGPLPELVERDRGNYPLFAVFNAVQRGLPRKVGARIRSTYLKAERASPERRTLCADAAAIHGDYIAFLEGLR